MKALGLAVAAAVAIGMVAGTLGAADEGASRVIYTKESAPRTPGVEELALRDSVSQYGITWTFDRKAPVGQFVNGDYYVVGPVTVTAIDPKPLMGKEVAESERDEREKRKIAEKEFGEADLVRNGSMLNPPAKAEVGYDSGIRNSFKPGSASKLPIEMKPTDSLVSSISLKQGEKASFVYHSSGGRTQGDNCPTKVSAVLTCVASPQPPDAFRPAVCDRQQTIYLARNLRRELLPNLPRANGAPDPVKFAEAFQKAWINPGFFGFDQPMENMPHYGQWVGQSVGDAGLLLCSDYKAEEKERLLLNFVQVGIDYWGMVKSGHPGWEGWGGHGSGRKTPIVFAGHLLGDAAMASPTKTFPKVTFGEDQQTRYGKSWTGATVVFTGHSGIHPATGAPPRAQWGPYEHIHPSKWDMDWVRDGKTVEQANYQSEAYRRSNTSCCWVGQALTMRLLGLEKEWNHDAFFDYVDRWMFEDDKPAREVLFREVGDSNMINPEKNWCHEGYTGEPWVKEMWNKYRSVSKAPTDGWKKDHGEEAAGLGANPAEMKPGARYQKLKERAKAGIEKYEAGQKKPGATGE